MVIEMAFNLVHEIKALAQLFHEADVDYAICGGIAVAIHGVPRATEDLDVLIREEDLPRFEEIARSAGFTLSSGEIPFDFGKPTERRIVRLVKAAGEDFLVLDLMIVTPILAGVWADRTKALFGETPIRVVSKRGLIEMKQAAGRPLDLRDIEMLNEAGKL